MVKINQYDVVESTQNICKEMYKEMNKWDVIVANKQKCGYGRTGLWDSLEKNLYFSIKLTDISLDKIQYLVGVSLCELLLDYSIKSYIKLPNDIYVLGKKIGGILIEPYHDGYIIGIGLNIFESETVNRTSMNAHANVDYNIYKIASELQKKLMEYNNINENMLFIKWQNYTTLVGKLIKIVDRKTNNVKIIRVLNLDCHSIETSNDEIFIIKYKFNY